MSLRYADSFGRSSTVNLLLARTDINLGLIYRNRYIPLHLAASPGLLEMLKELITENTVVVNAQDLFDITPLHYACEIGCYSIAELLMSHPDINLNAKDDQGRTPLAVVKSRLAALRKSSSSYFYLFAKTDYMRILSLFNSN